MVEYSLSALWSFFAEIEAMLQARGPALDGVPGGFDAELAEAKRHRKLLMDQMELTRPTLERTTDWDALPDDEHEKHCLRAQLALQRAKEELDKSYQLCTGSFDKLETQIASNRETLRETLGELERVLAEAVALNAESTVLLEQAAPELEREKSDLGRSLELVTGSIEAAAALRRDLQQDDSQQDLRVQVIATNRQLQVLAGHAQHQKDRQAVLRRAQAALSGIVDSSGGLGKSHCPACGGELEESDRFCSTCGTVRNITVTCQGCRATTSLPTRMLKRRWQRQPLFCEHCGSSLMAGHDEHAERSETVDSGPET